MTRWTVVILAVLLGGGRPLWAQTSRPTGPTDQPVALCELQDERIDEASGIVPSHRHPGCYYTHNDSGGRPQVFLIDRGGHTRLTIRLRNARALDYEDIALAPGEKPGEFDVCVADFGDNPGNRRHVTFYRFPEVALPASGAATVEVEATAYRVRYAEGPANAEAFCVHPRTGAGYILTKRTDGRSFVYKLPAPWDPQQETLLPRLLTLELPPALPLARVVTAADIASDGRRLAVRCYIDGWEWRLPAGAADGSFDDIFRQPPVRLTLAPESQGEALCYSADGRAILTVSEGPAPVLYERAARLPTGKLP